MVQVAGVWHLPPLPAPARSAGPAYLPALPNVPRDGGLFRKIPGKVGLQHPARKGDVLCRGWFGSGVIVLDVASWPCQGTGGRSLYRGNSRQKTAIFYETLFLLWHFILQIGCSWGLCVAVAAAA